eukprot:1159148-Pelagomonas_calceolata.AAC.2
MRQGSKKNGLARVKVIGQLRLGSLATTNNFQANGQPSNQPTKVTFKSRRSSSGQTGRHVTIKIEIYQHCAWMTCLSRPFMHKLSNAEAWIHKLMRMLRDELLGRSEAILRQMIIMCWSWAGSRDRPGLVSGQNFSPMRWICCLLYSCVGCLPACSRIYM